MSVSQPARIVGRYLLSTPIASGGMATVHLGRLLGAQGFTRTVAIKQLHPQYSRDPEFVSMFLDEARLASRIHHPNVVAPLDVVSADDEIFIVMEYVHGESLSGLLTLGGDAPLAAPIACSIMVQVLLGLHAAHEATDEQGRPLSVVHRDVSPQNILVGEDGVARVVDFGIAKAARRSRVSNEHTLKGKLGYMSLEQLRGQPIDRRSDVFSAGVVLWEMLTGTDLFPFDEPGAIITHMLSFEPRPIRELVPGTPPGLEAALMRALEPDRERRFQDARELAIALQSACPSASLMEVAAWVTSTAGAVLATRAARIAAADAEQLPEQAPIQVSNSAAPPPVGTLDGTAEASRERRTPRRYIGALLIAVGLVLGASVLTPWRGLGLGHSATRSLERLPRAAFVQALSRVSAPPAPTTAWRTSEPAAAAKRGGAPDARTAASSRVVRPLATSAAPRRTPRAQPAAPRPPADCTPPYRLDAQGIKRFKPECFRR